VQNSAGTNLLEQKDDGSLYVGTTASDLGVIYVPHSPTYAQRTFLRMQSGGVQIFATSSNDGLVVKTLGTTFEQKITINDGVIYGKSTAVATNVSAYNLPTQILCSSTANSCLINLSGGGRLQGSSDAQYIRIEGTILIDSLSNELKGFYFNPTLTGAFSPQNVLAIHSTYGGAYLNTATPQASAVLQADSTTQGFLPPRMTTAQRDAIATPAAGLKIFNTTLGTTDTYDGAAWQRFGQQTFIKGSGSTSATTSLLVQNSAGAVGLQVKDDGSLSNSGAGNMVLYYSQYWNISTSVSTIGNYISQQGVSFYSSQPFCINVAGGSHQTSSSFQIDSTTKGFLPPRMTTTQKNAIATPAGGLMVYDTDLARPCFFNGATWITL
jgi:hypothetical protein